MLENFQDKLDGISNRFSELTNFLSDPGVINDRERYRKFSKEHAELEPIVVCAQEWKKVVKDLQGSKELLNETTDPEMRKLAHDEVEQLKVREEELQRQLIILFLPKDPNDKKNIILEIRAGTGGDEAALFGGDLFNMYLRYAERRGFRVELLSTSDSSVGGYKELIARVVGEGAYSLFKYERGVHRVQRVPKTEAQGRIHTSTVTVAVLPEAEEVDVQIQDKDLRIDVFRSSGPGGQSVNTTDSAVRVTHLPTGLVVSCQDEKSQLKNKTKALSVLRARLLALKEEEQNAERRDDRRSQIGTGDRSERIRTYNFPQGRITDHRIGLTIYQIDAVLQGSLDLVIEPLIAHFQAQALKEGSGLAVSPG